MRQANGPSGIDRNTESPDGGSRHRRKRSPSDLRREARRLAEQLEAARVERRETWTAGGQSEFAADRQEQQLRKLHGRKRTFRRAVYAKVPSLEGTEFCKHHPGRTL